MTFAAAVLAEIPKFLIIGAGALFWLAVLAGADYLTASKYAERRAEVAGWFRDVGRWREPKPGPKLPDTWKRTPGEHLGRWRK